MRPLIALALGLMLISAVAQGAEAEDEGPAPSSALPAAAVELVKPVIGAEFVANDQHAPQRRARYDAVQQILALTRQLAEAKSETAEIKAQWWTMFVLTALAMASAAYLAIRPTPAASAASAAAPGTVRTLAGDRVATQVLTKTATHRASLSGDRVQTQVLTKTAAHRAALSGDQVQTQVMTKTDVHRASFPKRNPTAGFSLLEVMICVAVLAIALSAVLSNTYTLGLGQQLVKESSTAREIARLMSERIQGATWDSLGRRDDSKFLLNAWSWHRKQSNSTLADIVLDGDGRAGIRPMTDVPVGAGADGLLGTADDVTELSAGPDGVFGTADDTAVTAYHSLVAMGIVPGRTGLKNLRVYLEYYALSAFDDTARAADPAAQWKAQIALPSGGANVLSEDPDVFDLRSTSEAVLVRLAIVWTSSAGGDQTHELILCRRK